MGTTEAINSRSLTNGTKTEREAADNSLPPDRRLISLQSKTDLTKTLAHNSSCTVCATDMNDASKHASCFAELEVCYNFYAIGQEFGLPNDGIAEKSYRFILKEWPKPFLQASISYLDGPFELCNHLASHPEHTNIMAHQGLPGLHNKTSPIGNQT